MKQILILAARALLAAIRRRMKPACHPDGVLCGACRVRARQSLSPDPGLTDANEID